MNTELFSGKDLDLFFEKALNAKERKELDESDFGLPEQRKYPLIDGEHVKKAIQFFKYCPEKDRKILASNIYKAAKKYDVNINEESIIFKYIKNK